MLASPALYGYQEIKTANFLYLKKEQNKMKQKENKQTNPHKNKMATKREMGQKERKSNIFTSTRDFFLKQLADSMSFQ